MKTHKQFSIMSVVIVVTVLVLAAGSMAAKPPAPYQADEREGGLSLAPEPVTVDQVTHNVGNIVTTIDNYGFIGGYSYYDLPSGEWPRNSGRHYLAEIRYWMGTVSADGDTLVANTFDDFEALPFNTYANDRYNILLSTDTSRYHVEGPGLSGYDPTDTVGLGTGNPAYGWRVWNPDLQTWDYNRTSNVLLADSALPSGPTSLQDSHYRFGDAAGGAPLMGLEMSQTIYQWNYCYNEDFMFVVLDITNTSDEDYVDFAVGVYVDIDVGGEDGRGENGRLQDMVAFDSTENLAWIYDAIGIDPGWGPTVRTGIMGTKLLETPDDIGMTAFRSGEWDVLPDDDPGRYDLINSAQFDESLPPTDQYYIQCTRGINLTAGKTVRVVYALVAGEDEEDFRNNAALAQSLYDNDFIGPQPPPTPTLEARAGHRKIYINWNDTSEAGVDPMSGENDFVGYKLYRSDNQGKTWGIVNYQTGNNCLTVDYRPLATYTITSPQDPIPHSFIDTGLYNGVEYWYCLVAFDAGDTAIGVDPLQSGFGIAGEARNVIAVTPRPNPAGYYDAIGTIEHEYTGNEVPSDGEVFPVVFDEGELLGAEYSVVFEDTPEKTYWHLINETTGDTVLADQTKANAEPGEYDVVEGLRIVVNNGDHVPRDFGQTAFAGGETTLALDPAAFYGPALPPLTGDPNDVFGDAPYRATYELRYTTDSTRATWIIDGFYGIETVYWVPFECWNTTTNQRVSLAVYDFDYGTGGPGDGVWNDYDLLSIVDYPYNPTTTVTPEAFPNYYGWLFGFDVAGYNPAPGDVLTIYGAPLNGPDDRFTFKVDGVNEAVARNQLKDIKVVPNPYFARYSAMVETSEGESVIEFQNIPDECTIRIYTLAGDLVRTINHSAGDGVARWNLQSESRRQVASGVYLFHVESPYGEHLGRFSVVK